MYFFLVIKLKNFFFEVKIFEIYRYFCFIQLNKLLYFLFDDYCFIFKKILFYCYKIYGMKKINFNEKNMIFQIKLMGDLSKYDNKIEMIIFDL